MSAYPIIKPETVKVLRRKADGKYLEIWGWSIEWADKPSAASPKFTANNMGKLRYDDFHRDLYRRFRTVKARVAGQLCELVEAPTN